MRWVLSVLLLAVLLTTPMVASPVSAADVNKTLVAAGLAWHDGSASGAMSPTFEIVPGDTLRLRVENRDALVPYHTFTFPHFARNHTLTAGSSTNPTVVFVNITTNASDAGKWQFYCIPHSSGANESRVGMIGYVDVRTPPPPRTSGFETVGAIAAIAAAVIIVAVARRRRA